MTKVDIVPQHQGAGGVANKVLADQERLGQALWTRLLSEGEINPPLLTRAQETSEGRQIGTRVY